MNTPNLLILHCHDMGRYNSAYGFGLRTPHMQDLARESVLFRNAHCAAPTCSPSRAAMLTGKHAHEVGMMGLLHRGWVLRDRKEHLASILSEQGWHSAYCGVQHEFDDRCGCPYDEKLENGWGFASRDMSSALSCVDWLRKRGEEQEAPEPFYLWCGFFWPHEPFKEAPAERFPRAQLQLPSPLPDSEQTREDWAGYAASVENTDSCVGMILDALEASGLAENTIVVLTTDHGVPFPFMKCNLTAHGTGISLMIRDPREPGRDRCSDALVSHLDLVPTLCELLGAEAPQGLRGFSLKGLLEGGQDEVRETHAAEVTYHAGYEPKRGLRSQRWNYIRNYLQRPAAPMANIDQTSTKAYMVEAGLHEIPLMQEELYDLSLDPAERNNLAASTPHAELLKEFSAKLDQWMEETDDPLRHGHVPLPEGGWSNVYEAMSPREGPHLKGPVTPEQDV